MLEYPESKTISKQIKENLSGKIVSNIEILQTPHRFAFFKGDVDSYENLLEGRKITDATYHGGMVEIDFEDVFLIFADGAYPKYYNDKKSFPKKHQFALHFDDETAIFVSIQMYGEVFVFPFFIYRTPKECVRKSISCNGTTDPGPWKWSIAGYPMAGSD